jgi:uncharacterized membrane protein YqjE
MITPRLNAFHLKVIALVLMFGDHLAKFAGASLPADFVFILEVMGRIVAPIFFFLAVESFFKSSNRQRYILRLYGWAAVMAAGNGLMWLMVGEPVGLNIFLSLAVGLSLLASLEWARGESGARRWLGVGAAVLLGIALLFTEASYLALVTLIPFYVWHDQRGAAVVGYVAAVVLVVLVEGMVAGEFGAVMKLGALPLILLYNGERGAYSWKYFFYGFYPIHVWALYFVGYFIGR